MTRPEPLLRRAGALALVPLAAAAAFALWPGAGEAQSAAEPHAALFPVCKGAVRVTCVVDGDTFWLSGTKIRIADIDTPEVSQPRCPRERALGLAATERLRQLLNAGRFGLAVPADGRTRDRYGRELRIVTRGGQSLGAVLVREGLAARWGGTRKAWCGA
ncbi:MAG: thermonuclease family protein [Erythrobacter sp.]|uniref:thermonuclease family protein n=1 Tax=Erythrobacter sp. TaxID=1042 RepID=UPI0025E2F684|nr:thermonuclease family protein [Erythrobacter sp.]MCL9998209.1 thermonuclease family protein [Erythrobacter sp.]